MRRAQSSLMSSELGGCGSLSGSSGADSDVKGCLLLCGDFSAHAENKRASAVHFSTLWASRKAQIL